MTKYLFKFTKILFLAGFVASCFEIDMVFAYWNTVECKQKIVDGAELQEKGFSFEEISKLQQYEDASYEFCLAKKAIADKDAEDRQLGALEYSEAGYLEPRYFTPEGDGRAYFKLGSVDFFAEVTAQENVAYLKKKYPNLTKNLAEKAQKVNSFMDGIPCGPENPYGCAPGTTCFSKTSGHSIDAETNIGTVSETEYACKNPNDRNWGWMREAKGSGEGGDTFTTNVAGGYASVITDSEGNTFTEDNIISKKDKPKKKRDNTPCNISRLQGMYQSSCYSCKIILTLITTFMNACGKVYDLTRDAGNKVLIIGSMLWLAVFALKLVSAFTNQEPMQIVNSLFIFMFKVSVAYIVLNAGIGAIINLFVNPLLGAGADYGIGLLQAANTGLIDVPSSSSFPYNGTEIISSTIINKIMALTEGIDKTVSTHLVVGHALTCHAVNAGMITIVDDTIMGSHIVFEIPDIWVWICGAFIWFCGFMLTLGVGYYLLDVCFKIGFCIIALPIVIGLWPFGPTSSKFKSCISIIIRSAALFAFLALVVSYALSLVSASLGDLTTFYAKINAGDSEWISNTFSIVGSSFILILFAYIYSIHLVSASEKYTGKFFGDNVFGGASPMHRKMTQMTDFVKKTAQKPVAFVGGVVTHQAKRAVGAVAAAPVNYLKSKIHSSKQQKSAGAAVNSAGQGVEAAGKGVEAAGKGVEAAGKGVDAAGKGISGISQAANVIPVAGQVIAGAGTVAGTAVQAAGKATQAAGKATQAAGKVTQAAGKAAQAAGKVIDKAENAVKNDGNTN